MFITACGMVCPIGLTPASACAARRAGISGLKELRIKYRDQPIIGAYVPGLEPTLFGSARILELLVRSLSGVIQTASNDSWTKVPLLVALGEPHRPGGSGNIEDSVILQIQARLGVHFHPTFSTVFSLGHTAGFHALRSARELLKSGIHACVVVAADSLLSSHTLSWLDSQFRLKTEANPDGIIPGEAAAAVIVQKNQKM